MLNWPQLVTQGRAKDMGIAWTEEEQEALAALMAHANLDRSEAARYVRTGVTTVAAFEAAKNGGEVPATREDLEAEAKAAGIEFDPSTPDTVLASAIGGAKKAAKKAAKK